MTDPRQIFVALSTNGNLLAVREPGLILAGAHCTYGAEWASHSSTVYALLILGSPDQVGPALGRAEIGIQHTRLDVLFGAGGWFKETEGRPAARVVAGLPSTATLRECVDALIAQGVRCGPDSVAAPGG